MINYSVKTWSVGLVMLGLAACGGREDLAPVVESNWRAANIRSAQYVVRHGDTLYAIAFRYDRDYRELARANHLSSPYSLRVGQVIRIQTGYNVPKVMPRERFVQPQRARPRVAQPQFKPQFTPSHWSFRSSNAWSWPAHGHVVANFVPNQGKKGLDIAGKKGEKIYAAKNGVVAYAGSGLAGYGNLIIIKHDNQFLTAYGNNERNLVREGQSIRAGQVIADMGIIDRRFWGVHFEIRQSGKPVNPLSYLK